MLASMTDSTKVCSHCKSVKLLSEYYTRSQNGKKYPEARCKACSIARTTQRKAANPEYARRVRRASKRNQNAKERHERANGINRERYIYRDARTSDKKKGFEFDLNLEFISRAISEPCVYCADTNTQMTLDRIDNTIGHVMPNVVPACVRCNLVRGKHALRSMAHRGIPNARRTRARSLRRLVTG
jgi:hypothetical protein